MKSPFSIAALRIGVAAGALAFAFLVTTSAKAQDWGLQGDGAIQVRADVAGAMIVEPQMVEIYLGLLIPGQDDLNVDPDAAGGDYPVAAFRVAGPRPLAWRMWAEWRDLEGDDPENAGESLALGAPDGGDFCYSPDDDSGASCTVLANEDVVDDHDGEGWVFVGYKVVVPDGQLAGSYSNPEAIVLTAEASLN